MRLLITGICGFVGSVLARELKQRMENLEITGLDNLSRPGSEQNRQCLKQMGIRLLHGDIRIPSDLDSLPPVDWVLDAAANPSVLAGISGATSSRQLLEHNLLGTVNLLEYCRRHRAGFILLSTSRVYSLARLSAIPVKSADEAFVPDLAAAAEPGLSAGGVAENFSTQPPVSLYGCAKLASELLLLEYGLAFDFPVHVNRCGVLAGAGQFGKADQGIFSFWIHSWRRERPLRYIGFGGTGHQVRDCLHPRDLAPLLAAQMSRPRKAGGVVNVSGGVENSMSLAQLSRWCAERFGPRHVAAEPVSRPFDVPWLVLDSAKTGVEWGWRPSTRIDSILEEIAIHAEQHPGWLELTAET
jgi:CDP-paratose 2-epimerase